MPNVIAGGVPGFYIYWFRNGTFKGGDPSSDTQQPFNPITESTGITLPEQIYDLIAPVSNLYPQINVDKNQEPSTITFRMYFREPFLMLSMFSYKSLPSNWTGTSNTITANFSNIDNIDNNIGVQLRLPDPSGSGNNIDLFFDGGQITGYRWLGEAQGAVFEEVDIKFAEITESTQAVDIDDGFDDAEWDSATLDGGWAWWNKTKYTTKNTVLLTKNVTVTVDSVALPGLQVQAWELNLPVPVAMEHIASSGVAGVVYNEVQGPWVLNVSGKITGNNAITEAILALSSKAKATAKLEYDSSPLAKYFQFTNSVFKKIDGLSIPKAGESIDVTYVYEGAGSSVLTYSWTGSESDDPGTHINHTNV